MPAAFGDTQGLRSAAQALQRAQFGLSGVTQFLTSEVHALVPGCWQGNGAYTFTGHWQTRKQQGNQLSTVCGQISQILGDLAHDLDGANQLASKAKQAMPPPPVVGRGLDPGGEEHSRQLQGQAAQAAQAAWNRAVSRLQRVQLPRTGPPMTVSQVDAWAGRLVALPEKPRPTPWYDSLWHGAGHMVGDIGDFVSQNAGPLSEILGGLATADAGIGLIGAGLGGEAGGLLLDATGVGAIPGVALNVGGGAAIASGVPLAASGFALAGDGASHLTMAPGSGGSGGSADPEPPSGEEGGPGKWDVTEPAGGSERAWAYQDYVLQAVRKTPTWMARFWDYVVKDPQTGKPVSFDGYKPGAGGEPGTLVEAKGPGYAKLLQEGLPGKPFPPGPAAILDQAERQAAAANGTPITWYVAEPDAAAIIEATLDENGLGDKISVEFLPPPG